MKKLFVFSILALLGNFSSAQDFSNRGKDFWLCFPSHVPNERFGTVYFAKMSLFITADKASTGTVSIPGLFIKSFDVVPGQATEIDIPYNIAHINNEEAATVIRKGIRVKVDPDKPPVVVYSQIYAGFRSAASLILPSAVLGKKYYSMNAPQQSISGSKSQFVVVAIDSNTTVEIVPVRDGLKGESFTVTLPLPGDVYEYQDDKDLTGSSIESLSDGAESCKRIAVFSGSSAININSNNPCAIGDSYDPLYQQLYPVNAWGKRYGFIPFENYSNGNPFRILASENNTVIAVDGTTVAVLDEGEYYPDKNSFGVTETRSVFITADKPVSVAQYAQRSGCSGATPPPDQGYGDPDMVMLNPVEQNVNNITMFSSDKENIYSDSKFINILIRNQATNSFTINGQKPVVSWKPMSPANSGYSYAKIMLDGQSSFTLSADSGFNAVAYGFGDFESYAYSAGTNIKDLYRILKIENEFGDAGVPATCKGTPFRISVTFPYQPSKIKVHFNGLFSDETIENPIPITSFFINGRPVYEYRLSNLFRSDKTGSYPITVVAENRTFNSCNNGKDEIDFELQIIDRPKADWEFFTTGCVNEEIEFKHTSIEEGRQLQKWFWEFGDGKKGEGETIKHSYYSESRYETKHWAVNDIGCGTDTVQKLVRITNTPVAEFAVPAIACEQSEVLFVNTSSITGSDSIVQHNWNFGDGQQVVLQDAGSIKHRYTSDGLNTVSLQVASSSGCKSEMVTKDINIFARPESKFRIPSFCLPSGTGKFINESTIKDGTTGKLNYTWDFGDGVTDTARDPVHQYKDEGPYSVRLTVESGYGCSDTLTLPVTTIYTQAKVNATMPLESCLGNVSVLSVLTSTSANSKLKSYYWSVDDGSNFTEEIIHLGIDEGTQSFNFNRAGEHTIKIFGEVEANGCFTDTLERSIYINSLPVVGFKCDSLLCESSPLHFTDTSFVADGVITKWQWEIGKGQFSAEQNLSVLLTPGVYKMMLSAETDKGCKARSEEKQVTVHNIPNPDFEMPVVCENDLNVQFANTSKIADGSENDFIYQWRFNDIGDTAGPIIFSKQKDPFQNFTRPGNYDISLSVTGKSGCEASVTKRLTVNSDVSRAEFSIDQPVVCSNQMMTIKDNSSVDFGKIVKTEIYWDYEGQPMEKEIDTVPYIGKTYRHKYPGSGSEKSYTIKYVVYSGATCLNEFSKVVFVKASPIIKWEPPTGICEESAVLKLSASELNSLAGKEVFSGAGVSTEGWFNPKLAGPGFHEIDYAFTTLDGCVNNKKQTIEVYATPNANAGPDKIIEKSGGIILQGSGNGISYQWSPAIYLDNSNSPTPKASPEEDITYRLKVTSQNECVAFDDVNVKVLGEVFVPNAFTPNNDGLNDRWVIPDLSFYPECTVQVFNRYGQKIFDSKGYASPWDGTQNGVPLQAGSYVWQIQLKKGRKSLSGFVIIIR